MHIATKWVLAGAAAAAAAVMHQQVEGQWVFEGYDGYGGGSTVAGSYMQGLGQFVRSAGAYNLATSEAAKNLQEARSRALDNRLKGTETYFQMRRINQSYRDEQRRPQATSEQLHRLAALGAPSRLDANRLDPVSGSISWPLVLRQASYADYRQALEQRFAERSQTGGGIDYDTYKAIQAVVDQALAQLESEVEQYKPNDYIEAKKFLQSLAYEARFPVG